MAEFIADNAGTLATGLVLLAIAAAIVIKLIRDKHRGKCCSCGCGGTCPKNSG